MIRNYTYQDKIETMMKSGFFTGNEYKQACLFSKILKQVFKNDQLVNAELYQYWMVVSKFCHFPFVKLILIIKSVQKKVNRASNEEDVKHHINLFCDQ